MFWFKMSKFLDRKLSRFRGNSVSAAMCPRSREGGQEGELARHRHSYEELKKPCCENSDITQSGHDGRAHHEAQEAHLATGRSREDHVKEERDTLRRGAYDCSPGGLVVVLKSGNKRVPVVVGIIMPAMNPGDAHPGHVKPN